MARKMIGRLALILAMVTALSVFQTSCSVPQVGSSNTTGSGGSSGSGSGEPYTLTVSMGNEPPHLDSQCYSANITVMATDPIHGTLISYDREMNLIPNVAESWDFPEDRILEFKVRKGMKFHNGEPVTAQDVKASYERVLNPATGSTFASKLSVIQEIKVLDEYTGQILLKEPYAPLLDILTWVVIIPADSYDAQRTAPIGCGPYKFVAWEQGVCLRMEKFEDYWDADRIGPDVLIYNFYAETSTEVSALLAHEADIAMWIPATDYQMVSDAGIELIDNHNATFYYIGMNCEVEPFTDVRVRQAVALAVDKQACLDYILEGYGDTCDVTLDKKDKFYDSSLSYERDIEKAKQLLADAGYPNGFPAKISAPDTPTEGPLAEMMQQQLAEIGIELTVERQEVAIYIENVFTKQDFEFTICGYNATGDPDALLSPYFMSDGGTNIFNYSNKRVDELLSEAGRTYDFETRKALYLEYFKIMLEECPCVHLIQEKKYSAVWPGIEGYEFHPDLRHNYNYTRPVS